MELRKSPELLAMEREASADQQGRRRHAVIRSPKMMNEDWMIRRTFALICEEERSRHLIAGE